MKLCLRCAVSKPLSDFSKHHGRPDGLQAYCKQCTRRANHASNTRNVMRTSVPIPERKQCAACGEVKAAGDFFRDRRRRDGLYANCRACHVALTDAWKARNRDAVLRHRKDSYQRHADSRRAAARAYHAAHREERAVYKARWLSQNRALATFWEGRRRARKFGATGAVTFEQLLARVTYYGGRCWICRAPFEAIDHVKPLAAGGADCASNLRPICTPCNSRKGSAWPYRMPAAA